MHTIRLICVALLVAASACTAPPKKDPNVNLTGYPPEFRAGYVDGCESARRKSTQKDEKRYKADAQYAAGWRDGLDICGRQAR